MTDTNPSRGRRILQYITGFMVGAVMGILIWAAVLTLLGPFYPGEEGLSLVVAFVILGLLPSILVGGAMGLLFIRVVRRATRPRRVAGIGALLYIATLAAGILIVLLLMPWMEDRAREGRGLRAHDLVERTYARGKNSWNQVYVNRYPYNETSLAEVLGPLQYPRARLESWNDIEGNISGWDILTTTDDSPDQVLAFYASVLPRGIEGYPSAVASGNQQSWSARSTIQPSIDRLEVRVTLEGGPSGMRIRYKLLSPIMIDPDNRQPWSEDKYEVYLEDARKKRRKHRDTIAVEYAGWIYPGAVYTWGSLVARKQLAYETYDSIDQVVAFYESVKGESRLSDGQYIFTRRGTEWTPEFTVYPVGGKVRIHFRHLR